MRELEQRQKLKKRLYSTPALVVFTFITLAMARGAYDLVVKDRGSAKDAALLAQKVADLKDRETKLKQEIAKLQTDSGVEEEIKAKYNVAGAGEHVAIIVDKPEAATTTPASVPWYKRMWSAIIGQ